MRRVTMGSLMVAGLVLGFASSAHAQIPTPPFPPTPAAAAPVLRATGLYGSPRVDQLPPPICPPTNYSYWSCDVGVNPAHCHEERFGPGPYYQYEKYCVVRLASVVVECRDTGHGDQYSDAYDRSCEVTRADKPIAGCQDTDDASYGYSDITRRCFVGKIAYECEDWQAIFPVPKGRCSLSGVPRPGVLRR